MQQLHLVGFTTDLEGLIFSARKGSKSGSFVVPIDDGLLATIEDAQRLRNGEPEAAGDGVDTRIRATSGRPPRPESTLSPREIQARLRAGSTIAEVAAMAGVDEEWVSRFAAPILAEQRQVVERARRLVYAKSRLGDSAQPLGTSVLWNLVDRGLRMTEQAFEAGWRAWNLHGPVWVVQFTYVSRQRRQAAEWEVDLREATLHAGNRLAADLGHIESGRRRRAAALFEPDTTDAAEGGPARGRIPDRTSTAGATRAASARTAKTTKTATSGKTAKTAKAGQAASAAKRGAKAAADTKATKGKATKAGKATKGRKATKAGKATASAGRSSGGSSAAKRAAAGSPRKQGAASKAAPRAKAAAKRAPGAATRRTAAAARTTKRAQKSGGRKNEKGSAPGRSPAARAAGGSGAPAEERVSHLARPLQLPERRGAARDGTAPSGTHSAGSDRQPASARQPGPARRPSPPIQVPPASRSSQRSPSSDPTGLPPRAVPPGRGEPEDRLQRRQPDGRLPDAPRQSDGRRSESSQSDARGSEPRQTAPRRTEGSDREPRPTGSDDRQGGSTEPTESRRIERVRGRPPAPEGGAPASQGDTRVERDGRLLRRPPAEAPVVPPPPVAARAAAGEAVIDAGDESIIVRRAPERGRRNERSRAPSREPSNEPSNEPTRGPGEARADRVGRRLGRRAEAAASPAPVSKPPRLSRGAGGREERSSDADGAPRRPPSPPPPPAPPPSDEPLWHGPGSGEPAPPVRIRADLAAAAESRNDTARRIRRSSGRDRPLRAR